jgi:predicted outer membrane protein
MKKFVVIPIVALLASCGGGSGDTGNAGNASLLNNGGAVTGPATGTATTPSTTTGAAAGTAANTTSNATSNTAAALPVASAEFLATAHQSGLAEIAVARLAAERATNPEVRRFAQMLVADHTMSNASISQLLQSQNARPNTTATQEQSAAQQRLAALTGAEFDRAYLALNLEAHQRSVLLFMKQVQGGTNAQALSYARNMLPLLQTHLAMTEELYASIDPVAYLRISYQHGLAEIALSQLALEKASVAYVKPFAQMIIDHHTMLNAQIARVATQKNVTLPNAPSEADRAVRDHLAQLAGADFDKAYLGKNVIVHAGDAKATTAQSQNGSDQDVKALATASLPVITHHLQLATQAYTSVEPSFLAAAHMSNVGEILLAQRAVERATSAEVKAYAQHMVGDHAPADDRLIALAKQEGVVLPMLVPAEFFLVHRSISPLSGNAFDRAYMSANVDAHQKAVAMFTHYANNHPDPEQRAYAVATLPALQKHLQEAQAILGRLPAATTGTTGNTGATGTGTTGTGAGTTSTGTTGAAGTTGAGATGTGATGAPAATPAGSTTTAA